MEPAEEVCGDYYDVLTDAGTVKIGIGDVTGHGLESGVLILIAQTALRTLLESNMTDSQGFLDVLNRTLYRAVQRMNCDKNMTLMLLDYNKGILRLSGQHEEVIIVRANGLVERIDTIDLGFPIGLVEDITEFVTFTEVELQAGDVVILYTDGITEAINSHKIAYGLERLIDAVRENMGGSVAEIKQAVIEDLRRFIGRQKIDDDMTLVVLKQK